jgi:hypothetical protein
MPEFKPLIARMTTQKMLCDVPAQERRRSRKQKAVHGEWTRINANL